MDMHDHEKRMIDEAAELLSKLEKLRTFIAFNQTYNDLEPVDKQLLNDQCDSMEAYAAVLTQRIGRFTVYNHAGETA